MTTQVIIKNGSSHQYSDGKPNLHVVKVKVYNGGTEPQVAELGPGESMTSYAYPGQEIVLSEEKLKEVKNEVPHDGFDWRPSDV